MGLPTVVLATAGVPADPAYAEYGAALVVDSGPGLREALASLAADDGTLAALAAGRSALVGDMFAGARPGAAARAAAVVLGP
jgi:hypothetical protein